MTVEVKLSTESLIEVAEIMSSLLNNPTLSERKRAREFVEKIEVEFNAFRDHVQKIEINMDNLACGDCRFIKHGQGLQDDPPLSNTSSYHCRKTGLRITPKIPACPDIAREIKGVKCDE